MKSLLTAVLLFLTFTAKAQNHNVSKTNSGYLITNTDSIVGIVSIDLQTNSILFGTVKGLQNYSAKQVKKVVFFNNSGEFKTYVSGYWGSQHQACFFEELVSGPSPLLYREGMKFDTYDNDEFPPYFTIKNESIFSLGSKKEIINLFRNENDIVTFVRKNKLKVKVKEDLILIFSHANGINSMNSSTIAVDEI